MANCTSNGASMTVPMPSTPTVTRANMIRPTRNSALKYRAKLPTPMVRIFLMSASHGAGVQADRSPPASLGWSLSK